MLYAHAQSVHGSEESIDLLRARTQQSIRFTSSVFCKECHQNRNIPISTLSGANFQAFAVPCRPLPTPMITIIPPRSFFNFTHVLLRAYTQHTSFIVHQYCTEMHATLMQMTNTVFDRSHQITRTTCTVQKFWVNFPKTECHNQKPFMHKPPVHS